MNECGISVTAHCMIRVMGPCIPYVDHDSITSLTHFRSLLMTRHTFRVDRA